MQKIIKRRAYLSELVKWLDTPFIKVITGIRRSGKSTLLQNIKQELQNRGINEMQIIYLNFESFARTDQSFRCLLINQLILHS